MISKISENILISIETFYQPEYSNPLNNEYTFAYRITIENHNRFAIKLLYRYWHIIESNGQQREVEGEGVIGVQPVIEPGESFRYVSGSNFKTDMGRMHGEYLVQNENSKSTFRVKIPPFDLVASFKNN